MKPEWVCSRIPADMFTEFDQRQEAAKFCHQCPARQECLIEGLKERAQEQVRGGMWFNTSSRPQKIPVHYPRPYSHTMSFSETSQEHHMAMFLTEHVVPRRHDVWKIGPTCQRMSRKHGVSCDDYICRTIAREVHRRYVSEWTRQKRKKAS